MYLINLSSSVFQHGPQHSISKLQTFMLNNKIIWLVHLVQYYNNPKQEVLIIMLLPTFESYTLYVECLG